MIITTNFSEKIIIWYKEHGRKTLPWQIKKTPYTIWISEIMLQQTQMIRVIPYFQRFTYEFPDIQKLATSKLDQILYLWSGLGYYARAYNIHKTAKIIVNKYHSTFPTNIDILISLPGIGRSTAGAILSLSLEQKHPILDSNVKRILTRYYTIDGYLKNNQTEKKLWNLINNIIPNTNISQFNQGIMDLGETICTIIPKCNICPLNNTCQANIKHVTHLYPNKKSYKIMKKKTKWLLILRYKHTIWIEKRPLGKIWGGLFSFPEFSTEKKLHDWLLHHNLNIYQYITLPILQHKFTHYSLDIIPIIININKIPNLINRNKKTENTLWFNLIQPQTIGLPQPIIQLITMISLKQ